MVNHGQYENKPWSIMVNQAPMSHCNKDCLNVKDNHGQPSSTMVKRA